ncbi:MAG: NAD-dependent epimerase/dehydratase family protein [Rhodoferax sp.]|uniref:NAD-dependent epimerase/dehydratase family protein n=1 Tax=Rhodoferax sp. TaxID=50421 RepID=UPI001B6DDDEE|nr:NAD-dependent epimerase/dehydratase family protein [Rhodoferax sp.]MBP9907081.1 NAD-dependent epimerase/dehydratase family protein [Rhodoferax sp.]
MKILVTGASGFVGSSFLRRFSGRSDLDVWGVARRATDLPNYTRMDLSSPFDLDLNPDVVIHAAARASPWGSQRAYHAQNVLATTHVIDYCQRHGYPRLIYVSSSSVFYREEHQLGLTETSPIGPNFINAYAQTKYRGEELVSGYPGEKLVLRPRAVFGPGDTVLFPRILEAAAKGKLPLFTGQDQPVLGDLIYIDVLCDYLLAAATAPNLSGSYNLTNAQPIEIQAFLLQILNRLGLPAPTRQVSVATALRAATVAEWFYRLLHLPGEPPITRFGVGVFAYSKTFDVSHALLDLGPPSVSLDDGVDRFITWQKRQCV